MDVFFRPIPDGCYSMKSGYHLATDLYTNLSHFREDSPWLWLWSGHVLPKVKEFAWRCMKNYVPTKVRLIDKHINVSDASPHCGGVKSLDHTLLLCPIVQAVWQQTNGLHMGASLHTDGSK
ncbi:hypothetical protein PVK06_017874 [Gossypium arboreum]|uniref:Reverse transcriptase zinc-binding domain-containing protein n=1 Tax=Gossypium arboreum TaxID=29729 RepID=A0ABR0Q4D4_GOSAR|nr:hypothetical protein PVK06_017874 [Gossypium arboreum]